MRMQSVWNSHLASSVNATKVMSEMAECVKVSRKRN